MNFFFFFLCCPQGEHGSLGELIRVSTVTAARGDKRIPERVTVGVEGESGASIFGGDGLEHDSFFLWRSPSVATRYQYRNTAWIASPILIFFTGKKKADDSRSESEKKGRNRGYLRARKARIKRPPWTCGAAHQARSLHIA